MPSNGAPVKKGICKLSYIVFVAIGAWKVFFSNSTSGTSLSFYDLLLHQDANATSITKVLITRTVSPSEIQPVIDDIMHVKSFYTSQSDELKQKSRLYCNVLKEAGYNAILDPFLLSSSSIELSTNGTQFFPNHILCNSDDASVENYYATVRVDFMLFARSEEYAHKISKTITQLSESLQTKESLHEVKIDIRDVSSNSKKLWNWMLYADDKTLAGYDYIWFIDGDISLKSLNWQAFWQQVKLIRPCT